jgi:hypothetical protein
MSYKNISLKLKIKNITSEIHNVKLEIKKTKKYIKYLKENNLYETSLNGKPIYHESKETLNRLICKKLELKAKSRLIFLAKAFITNKNYSDVEKLNTDETNKNMQWNGIFYYLTYKQLICFPNSRRLINQINDIIKIVNDHSDKEVNFEILEKWFKNEK